MTLTAHRERHEHYRQPFRNGVPLPMFNCCSPMSSCDNGNPRRTQREEDMHAPASNFGTGFPNLLGQTDLLPPRSVPLVAWASA